MKLKSKILVLALIVMFLASSVTLQSNSVKADSSVTIPTSTPQLTPVPTSTPTTTSSCSDAKVIATIPVGYCPQGIAFDSGKNEIFVANLGSDTVSVISDTNDILIANITVGWNPFGLAYDSFKSEVYVANSNNNGRPYASSANQGPNIPGLISVISDETNTVIANVTVGNYPYEVAYDSGKGEIFVTNKGNNTVSVISDENNTVVATIPVGSYPFGITYDSGKNEIFVANNGPDTLSVISDETNTVIDNVTLGASPDDMAYDPSKNELFVTTCGFVSIVSDLTDTVVANVSMPEDFQGWLVGIAYDSAKSEVFVANSNYNLYFFYCYPPSTIYVISDKTNTITSIVTVSLEAWGVAYDSGVDRIFVSNALNGWVSVISESPTLEAPFVPFSDTVVQGETFDLTSKVTTGVPPYTYQWFSQAPNTTTYLPIANATFSSFNFAATASTPTGHWNFILQVIDATGLSVNSTATIITVNPPTPTPSPSQTSAADSPKTIEIILIITATTAIFVILLSLVLRGHKAAKR